MARLSWRRLTIAATVAGVIVAAVPLTASADVTSAATDREAVSVPTVSGPIPGTVPGDRLSDNLEDTYPFFSTHLDLSALGYVEEEFYLSGVADGWDTAGTRVATDVPYTTRIVVRRPVEANRFNGTVLTEWQNVTAGYDLDALWNEGLIREGYAWVGVSAQRVGVDQLRGWSPTRYGMLDVTGGGVYVTDQLSYDIFAQAAKTIRTPGSVSLLGSLEPQTILAVGASQSAGRMTVYYDRVLPQVEPVFDGYGYIVGSAPSRVGEEPVFQVLSETDVRTPVRRPDSDLFRRWEVAGSAHSGWAGQVYRRPLQERDLGAAPVYQCDRPHFSRVPLHHVTLASYGHLARWVQTGAAPPAAEPLQFNADGTKARNELGLALGGIQLSQVAVPIALNDGDNSGPSFCRLFGTHVPFDAATLQALYPTHGGYVAGVVQVDQRNVLAGYILAGDARQNRDEAAHSGIGGDQA